MNRRELLANVGGIVALSALPMQPARAVRHECHMVYRPYGDDPLSAYPYCYPKQSVSYDPAKPNDIVVDGLEISFEGALWSVTIEPIPSTVNGVALGSDEIKAGLYQSCGNHVSMRVGPTCIEPWEVRF